MKLSRLTTPLNTGFGQILSTFFDDMELPRADFFPAVDISETPDAYLLKAELPGVKREQIQVEVKDQTLILKGERKFSQEEKRENYHRIERSYGNFVRSFAIPNNVESDKVDAKFVDGLLEIKLTKRPESKPVEIKIS